MIHSPRQRRYVALSAFLRSFTRTSRAPKPRQHGLTFKLCTALFAVMAVLVGTAAAAFANAANPLPDASGTANVVNGNVTQNADGIISMPVPPRSCSKSTPWRSSPLSCQRSCRCNVPEQGLIAARGEHRHPPGHIPVK